MNKPQPQSDGALCRELWAAIESRPPLRVGSVIVSSRRYRWACLVVVPWSRYAIEVDCREDLDNLLAKLAQFEAGGLAAGVAECGATGSKPPAELAAAEPPDKWSCPQCGRRTESAFSRCDDCAILEVNAFTSNEPKPKRKPAGADCTGGQMELGLF